MTQSFLKNVKGQIVDANGEPVYLRGVNLGGWLMMEAYIMHAPNHPEHRFRSRFKEVLGEPAWQNFETGFRNHFIMEADIERLAQMGVCCLRVPFHYRALDPNYKAKGEALAIGYIDQMIEWCRPRGIYLILDMHAAPGSQNHEWHSDSYGAANFWEEDSHRQHAIDVWVYLADRYKEEIVVAGYDLLNEPTVESMEQLNAYYKQLIPAIRSVDNNHLLFVEGHKWSTQIEGLADFDDDNYAVSIHFYHPVEFTFHLEPGLHYPLSQSNLQWNKSHTVQHVLQYHQWAKERSLPIFVGEFGINARDGLYGEDKWLEDTLTVFEECGFHWTYWTYKAIKNGSFPDGLLNYMKNDLWINRQGPLYGWETYHLLWKDHHEAITQAWKSQNYRENHHLTKILESFLSYDSQRTKF